MSDVQDEQYHIRWPDDGKIKIEDIIREFGDPPEDLDWQQVLVQEEPCRWETLEEDMKRVSAKQPGVLFSVEITKYDSKEQLIQYHRDGQHYEAREVRTLPEFEKELLK